MRSRPLLRTLDLAVVGILAPLWVPVLVGCAVAVVVTSGRPVFYRQPRIGQGGRRFDVRKFRSMHNGDNPLVPDPSRITPIGTLLRRTSLDELPQLLHVLRGQMSLVGPRPMLPEQSDGLTAEQARRHTVRPGLTGLAQVNGRNAIAWEERLAFDCAWAADPTASSYLRILVRTVRVVVTGAGIAGHDPSDPLVDLVDTTVAHAPLETCEVIELTDDHRLRTRKAA